jgi:hypothetical protein
MNIHIITKHKQVPISEPTISSSYPNKLPQSQNDEPNQQPHLSIPNREHHHLSPTQHNTMPLALSPPESANVHVCSPLCSPAVRPYSRFLVRFLLPTQSPLIPILTNATGSAANAATPTAHASVQTDAQSMAITNVLDAMSTRAHSLNHARDVEGDLASMLVFLMAFCERMRNVGRVVD